MRSRNLLLSLASCLAVLLTMAGPVYADETTPPETSPETDGGHDTDWVTYPAIAGSEEPDFEPLIVGGTRATSSRGMATVMIDGVYACSGSIVDNRWVLTAKHCLYSGSSRLSDSRISVRVKSLNRSSGGGVVQVMDSKVRNNHDIGMLKLNRSANAERVRLPSAHSSVGATTYVFGWGRTCSTCSASSVLKRATQRVTSNAGRDGYGGRAIITSRGNGDTCFGDSGGPLFKLVDGNRYQVGVVSGGNAQCNGSVRYASVPESRTWIQNVIRNH